MISKNQAFIFHAHHIFERLVHPLQPIDGCIPNIAGPIVGNTLLAALLGNALVTHPVAGYICVHAVVITGVLVRILRTFAQLATLDRHDLVLALPFALYCALDTFPVALIVGGVARIDTHFAALVRVLLVALAIALLYARQALAVALDKVLILLQQTSIAALLGPKRTALSVTKFLAGHTLA
jgi:hypothetical protein